MNIRTGWVDLKKYSIFDIFFFKSAHNTPVAVNGELSDDI